MVSKGPVPEPQPGRGRTAQPSFRDSSTGCVPSRPTCECRTVRGPFVSSPKVTAGIASAVMLFVAMTATAVCCCTCRYLYRRRQQLQVPFAGMDRVGPGPGRQRVECVNCTHTCQRIPRRGLPGKHADTAVDTAEHTCGYATLQQGVRAGGPAPTKHLLSPEDGVSSADAVRGGPGRSAWEGKGRGSLLGGKMPAPAELPCPCQAGRAPGSQGL